MMKNHSYHAHFTMFHSHMLHLMSISWKVKKVMFLAFSSRFLIMRTVPPGRFSLNATHTHCYTLRSDSKTGLGCEQDSPRLFPEFRSSLFLRTPHFIKGLFPSGEPYFGRPFPCCQATIELAAAIVDQIHLHELRGWQKKGRRLKYR